MKVANAGAIHVLISSRHPGFDHRSLNGLRPGYVATTLLQWPSNLYCDKHGESATSQYSVTCRHFDGDVYLFLRKVILIFSFTCGLLFYNHWIPCKANKLTAFLRLSRHQDGSCVSYIVPQWRDGSACDDALTPVPQQPLPKHAAAISFLRALSVEHSSDEALQVTTILIPHEHKIGKREINGTEENPSIANPPK